ncbi:hypothetical protein CR164_00265 [Prosthecochloris marina]|uniref:SoxXA-binding protein n=1 Tax=Prosthecochloris marina TaxID=2017681 RepID=A0A317T8L6_9CHLB|nr:hypothetical protein [Prosthecochloris marina]PWW83034.1 hypothetical protein CR164_00265 [Prosthecochloris marina]
MKKLMPWCCFLILLLSGPALYAAPSAEQLILQAEEARKGAADLGFEWRDTASLIAEAREALEKGLEEQAAVLAGEALRQGELAIEQGTFMHNHWQEFIPEH